MGFGTDVSVPWHDFGAQYQNDVITFNFTYFPIGFQTASNKTQKQ
jgi:hypothetical protein